MFTSFIRLDEDYNLQRYSTPYENIIILSLLLRFGTIAPEKFRSGITSFKSEIARKRFNLLFTMLRFYLFVRVTECIVCVHGHDLFNFRSVVLSLF